MEKTIKELIKLILKKHNKIECIFVKKANAKTMGFMGSGKNMVKFDLVNDKILVEANITKDNIHLYYEFMSEDDKKYHCYILDDILGIRCGEVRKVIRYPYAYSTFKSFNYCTGLNGAKCFNFYSRSEFGVEDTLKPIEEYITEIKKSEAYKEYMASLA